MWELSRHIAGVLRGSYRINASSSYVIPYDEIRNDEQHAETSEG
jgi:hypothetical protein